MNGQVINVERVLILHLTDLFHVGSQCSVRWPVYFPVVHRDLDPLIQLKNDQGIYQVAVKKKERKNNTEFNQQWNKRMINEHSKNVNKREKYRYRWLTYGVTPKEFIQFRNVLSSLDSPGIIIMWKYATLLSAWETVGLVINSFYLTPPPIHNCFLSTKMADMRQIFSWGYQMLLENKNLYEC